LIPTSRIYADEAGGIPHDETPRVHIAARWPAWPLAEPAQQRGERVPQSASPGHSYFVAHSAMGCVK
jgi:hypothetical protein